MGVLASLPTLAEVRTKTEQRIDERKAEAAWKKAVWTRDRGHCRWCRRVCRQCLDLAADRGEVHHVSGRVVRALRWDRRNGLLLCAACHERVTGRVAEKVLMHSRHTFTVDGVRYLDADRPVHFKRIV